MKSKELFDDFFKEARAALDKLETRAREWEQPKLELVPENIQFLIFSDVRYCLYAPDRKHYLYHDRDGWNYMATSIDHNTTKCHLIEVPKSELQIGKFYFCTDGDICKSKDKLWKYGLYIGNNTFIYIENSSAEYYPQSLKTKWAHYYEVREVEG